MVVGVCTYHIEYWVAVYLGFLFRFLYVEDGERERREEEREKEREKMKNGKNHHKSD